MDKTQLWIDGRWTAGDKSMTLKNPHTGEDLREVGCASVRQAEIAIASAYAAFDQFRQTSAHERADVLYRVSEILTRRLDEAARILSLESAKPLASARAEMQRTIQTYRFSAEAAKSITGTTVPMDAAPRGEHHTAYVIKRPMGVVSAITPFNFPFNLVAHKVGPAIAAGNTVVLKPAEQTPLSALFLADVFHEAGLTDGVLNIIPGYGEELGEVLTTHPKVAFVTFTGSPRVGRIIRQQAGLRRVTLELGSNSPLLVDGGFSDEELDRIASETVTGAFAYNGQVCISIQRVYAHQSVFEPFVRKLVQKTEQLTVGNPLDESTDISALINDAAVTRLKKWLQNAVDSGSKILTGGTFDGNVMHPTVLADVPDDVELTCEEAFGPIVTVTPFHNWRDAIDMANASKFGLNAGVFTKSLERSFEAADRLETGDVLINQIPTFRVDHMPYGGIKESGSGREGVHYAMEDMMEIKMVAFRTGVFTD